MDNRRDEWRAWVDKTLGAHEIFYERLDNRVHNAETISNEARAEFRAIRDEIKKELRQLHQAIEGDPTGFPGLRQDIAELKAGRSQKEKREGNWWSFLNSTVATVGTILVSLITLAGFLFLNWDKIQEQITLYQHAHQAAAIERDTKKAKAKRAHKPRPKPKPVPAVAVPEPEAVEPETVN